MLKQRSQVKVAYSYVKQRRSNVQLHVTSLRPDNPAMAYFKAVGLDGWKVHRHEESLWELFVIEDLIVSHPVPDVQTGHQLRFWISSIQHASFHASQTDVQVLSPDAEEELDCIEEDKIYVIGGLVDRVPQKKRSLLQAQGKAGAISGAPPQLRRLPVKRFASKGAYPILNVDTVVKILVERSAGEISIRYAHTSPHFVQPACDVNRTINYIHTAFCSYNGLTFQHAHVDTYYIYTVFCGCSRVTFQYAHIDNNFIYSVFCGYSRFDFQSPHPVTSYILSVYYTGATFKYFHLFTKYLEVDYAHATSFAIHLVARSHRSRLPGFARFYFVNYPDDDIKRYTWSTINTTLSIFTAVLAFNGLDQLMVNVVVAPVLGAFPVGSQELARVLVGFVAFLAWYGIALTAIALAAGLMKRDDAELKSRRTWVITDFMRGDHGTAVNGHQLIQNARSKGIADVRGVEARGTAKSSTWHSEVLMLARSKRKVRPFCVSTVPLLAGPGVVQRQAIQEQEDL
ncbi:unnamed protein product [Durusdinium trenchii]|uniref:tRNA (guanine(9)-N(1))-methyltransferase n=1 Tax=Durusdinium trenchii TaxID=1381693 RepID=A0ABP0SC29_9DINO